MEFLDSQIAHAKWAIEPFPQFIVRHQLQMGIANLTTHASQRVVILGDRFRVDNGLTPCRVKRSSVEATRSCIWIRLHQRAEIRLKGRFA